MQNGYYLVVFMSVVEFTVQQSRYGCLKKSVQTLIINLVILRLHPANIVANTLHLHGTCK